MDSKIPNATCNLAPSIPTTWNGSYRTKDMIIFSDYNEIFTTDVKSNIDFKDKVEFLHHAKTHGIFLP